MKTHELQVLTESLKASLRRAIDRSGRQIALGVDMADLPIATAGHRDRTAAWELAHQHTVIRG